MIIFIICLPEQAAGNLFDPDLIAPEKLAVDCYHRPWFPVIIANIRQANVQDIPS